LRPLNQNAVSHTFVPGDSVLENSTSMLDRPVLPRNCHSARPLGGCSGLHGINIEMIN
jgi:hypothetical protein